VKLQRFEVESYMTLHENNCRYNLADTVAKSLTLKELLAYDKKDSLNLIFGSLSKIKRPPSDAKPLIIAWDAVRDSFPLVEKYILYTSWLYYTCFL